MTSLKAKSYIGKLVLEHRTSSCPGDYLLSLPRWGRFNAFAQCISAVVRRVLHHPRDVLIALSDPRLPPPRRHLILSLLAADFASSILTMVVTRNI